MTTFEKKMPIMNFSNSEVNRKTDGKLEDKIQELQRKNRKEQQTELEDNTNDAKLNDLFILTNTLKSKINELKRENDELRQKNNELKQKNDELKQKNDELKQKDDELKQKNDELKQKNDELKQKNDELKQKNDELERKLLYLAAEYENNKKRSKLDLESTTKFAISKFAIDTVNIYDVLLTALQSINPEKTDKVLADGVKMTISEFNKMFNRVNITKIEPEIGSVFDHNKHEAISRDTDSNLEIGCITKVVRAGYELYGRLLRPAMVIVSSGKL